MAKSKKKPASKNLTKNKPANKKKVAKTVAKKAAAPKKAVVKKVAPKKVAQKKSVLKKIVAKKAETPKVTKTVTDVPTKKSVKKTTAQDLKSLMQKLSPLEDRIVCLAEEKAQTTASGLLFIPDTVTTVEGYITAKVLACGKGTRNKKGQMRPLDVEVGQSIYFPKYSATEIQLDGTTVWVIREKDVLGVKTV